MEVNIKRTLRLFSVTIAFVCLFVFFFESAHGIMETIEYEESIPHIQTLIAAIYTDNTYQEPFEGNTTITVTGGFPEGAEALAFPVTVETDMQVLCAYDIAIRLPDDSLFEPQENAPITIQMQSPEFAEINEGLETEVYYVSMVETTEHVESRRTGSEIVFEADRLSVFMVVAVPTDNNPEDPTTIAVSNDFFYENDYFSIVLHVEGNAYFRDRTQERISEAGSDEPMEKETPVLVVTELDEQHTEYQQIVSAIEEVYAGGLLDLSVISMEFFYYNVLLDVSSCSITAEVIPQPQMMETAKALCAEMEGNAEPGAEVGVVFTVVEASADGTKVLDSAMVEAYTQEAPVLRVSVSSSGVLAVAAGQTANPKFTVQYYAWLDIVANSGNASDSLPVIDTGGAALPRNGTTPTTKTLYLEEMEPDSGTYGIKTVSALTEVYSSHLYEYITAPNPAYFNRLYENGNYVIKEIWILKQGMNGESVDPGDWDVYPPDTHFTNRPESVNENTVLITEGTVIRLVFDTTGGKYTNAVNFYDYDITNDGVHTEKQGINSDSNYPDTGTHLAFGNNNTDTGLGELYWGDNQLNKYNNNGFNGCTFGLTTRLNGESIQYANGVSAPNLFDDGPAIGKTCYDNGQYSLSFDRIGDTYTLQSVGIDADGTESETAKDLQKFTWRWNWNKTRKIWSNNFWPMDNVTNADPHTGEIGNTGTYIGASGKSKDYPESDNGIAHNNMFGMTYMVEFTLTEDYIGPLEYYFFGDDDMWVFLDGELVCDIGGVHSSVGEYVNLWDYVEKGSAGTHTLRFFYTERGLSGSTCYMQFTLPSVSSITPEQNTGLLKIQKLVVGSEESDEEFHFDIQFTDASGNALPDDYSYTRYTADGTVVMRDVIIYDGGSFDLKAGEYVIINYLPYGTRYTIAETNVTNYFTSYQVDDGTSVLGYTAEGQILTGKNGDVVFTNTAVPFTGGTGTELYAILGIPLTTVAFILLYLNIEQIKKDIASS